MLLGAIPARSGFASGKRQFWVYILVVGCSWSAREDQPCWLQVGLLRQSPAVNMLQDAHQELVLC